MNRSMRRFAPAILLALASLASAQSPTTAAPTFEVASIRMVDPHSAEELRRGIGALSMSPFPTNLFTLHNAPLSFLIQVAYSVDTQDNISAMPGWMESQEYDISAKVEGDQQLTLEQLRPMLQQLLAQRFHLAVHHESKLVSGFALVIAKGGPKLQPPAKAKRKAGGQILPNGLNFWNMDVAHFATVLARPAGQPVIDKTGLTGSYDFNLSYAPANDPNSNLPSIFTAIQEQLGLKLEPQKVPVETLVIDHADRTPTEN